LIWIKRLWWCRYPRCECAPGRRPAANFAAGLTDDPGGAGGLFASGLVDLTRPPVRRSCSMSFLIAAARRRRAGRGGETAGGGEAQVAALDLGDPDVT
jgi:hypothetical protein